MIALEIVCPDGKYLPSYGNETDARMDLKVKIPQGHDVIEPNQSKVFGTGIKVKIPIGYEMNIVPRSSTGIKLNLRLMNSTGIIDAGYRDEIRMAIHNFGTRPVTLEDGQRIAQFKLERAEKITLVQVQDNEEFRQGNRGGGIGSTGR